MGVMLVYFIDYKLGLTNQAVGSSAAAGPRGHQEYLLSPHPPTPQPHLW